MKRLGILLTAVIALVALSCPVWTTQALEGHWDGAGQYTFRMRIIDGDSLEPVPSAEVAIVGPVRPDQIHTSGRTGSEGVCELTGTFSTHGNYRSLKWIGIRWDRHSYVSGFPYLIRVSASGFQPFQQPFHEVLGGRVETTGGLRVSGRTIHLKREDGRAGHMN